MHLQMPSPYYRGFLFCLNYIHSLFHTNSSDECEFIIIFNLFYVPRLVQVHVRRRSYPLRHPFPSPNAKHWGVYAVKAAMALARHRYPISLSRGTK